MTCKECKDCAPLTGDLMQCLKRTAKGNVYGWIFSKTLAAKQALCDNKTNCITVFVEEHKFGPQTDEETA